MKSSMDLPTSWVFMTSSILPNFQSLKEVSGQREYSKKEQMTETADLR